MSEFFLVVGVLCFLFSIRKPLIKWLDSHEYRGRRE